MEKCQAESKERLINLDLAYRIRTFIVDFVA